jgi:homoserine O-acetyltransferase
MTSFALSPRTRRLTLERPLLLESGELLPQVSLAYRTWGELTPEADNAVIVCHALTGSADADQWWRPLFGAGRSLDPGRQFIVCSNVLGGCYGSSGPLTLAPDGQPWGGCFPRITIRDQVRAQMALADALGVRRIRYVIGGSMGGLQALEWALLDPQRVAAVVSIAAAGRHSAWCVVWSEAQRLALASDPKFKNGHYHPADPPLAGLAAARAVAMITYRSPHSLDERFGRAAGKEIFGERARAPDDFAIRGWLRHHAEALVERFDANSYRLLLDAMDTHDLAHGRWIYEDVVRQIQQPVLVVSVSSDALYVPRDQRSLHSLLPNSRILEIDSAHGHDGFLIDAETFEPEIRRFVKGLPDSRRSLRHADEQRSIAAVRPLKYAW